jgi:hypothetical protein
MGCTTTAGQQGLGQVTLFHIPSVGMLWVGLDLLGNVTKSPAPGALPTPQSTAGTEIVRIDKLLAGIIIEVASADTIRIQSNFGPLNTTAGNVTLIW